VATVFGKEKRIDMSILNLIGHLCLGSLTFIGVSFLVQNCNTWLAVGLVLGGCLTGFVENED